jgi:hypothetical protein
MAYTHSGLFIYLMFNLFTYGLFNDFVIVSDYMASNNSIINELERTWERIVVA